LSSRYFFIDSRPPPLQNENCCSRDLYEVGEIAFWPPGKAFCVFFGPTPASADDTPTMASPGVPLGKIKANATALRGLGSSARVKIAKKD